MFMFLFQKKPATKTGFVSNGTELITQLIFLFPVPCSLSQRVNLILSDYLVRAIAKHCCKQFAWDLSRLIQQLLKNKRITACLP